MTRIGIIGAGGRMGLAIASAVDSHPGASLAGGIGRGDDVAALASESDALIDFSIADALPGNLDATVAAKLPIVIGTTGLGPVQQALIERAAARIPVLQSANMSLGIALLSHLAREAAARLGEDWDIEIVEMHHRHKIDSPSGTALMLGRAAAQGRGVDLGAVAERGRDGMAGPRTPGDIGFASLRGGSVPGDHQVIFAGERERIELGHRAESRAIFARGAVRAALWLKDQPPGLYTMADVLGL